MEGLPLFTTMLTALAVENTVFSRALGLNKPALYLKDPKTGMLYGGVFVWVTLLSSLLASGVNVLLLDAPYARYVRSIGFLVSVGVIFIATNILTSKLLPEIHRVIRRILPLTTFNTALFGALYMSIQQDFTHSVAYALGTGIGYALAIQVIFFARRRLEASPVPRSFRGIPVLLVYIGLLSLAIYGLIGHGLPT